jgi:hypothetical protein
MPIRVKLTVQYCFRLGMGSLLINMIMILGLSVLAVDFYHLEKKLNIARERNRFDS